jgi:hypothetical protein
MEDTDLTSGDLLSDKMQINLHILGALMLNRVGGKVHDADVVVADKGAPTRWTLELMKQLAQPGGLSDIIGDNAVLSLHTGLGDDRLSFGRSRHQIVLQEHRIAGCRAKCVRTASPVSVGVDDEVGAGRATQKQIIIWCPLKVAQDALHGR